MADHPIIFSAPMVRALLDGRKTQTRRLLKHKSIDLGIALTMEADHAVWIQFHHPKGGPLTCVKWPYTPGDRLYVREAHSLWADADSAHAAQWIEGSNDPCIYRADYKPETGSEAIGGSGWRPSIHMPRWASRLTLTVTEVRVQRLQEISEADAWAEGCKPGELNARGEPFPAEEPHAKGGTIGWDNAVDWYADLWNSLHGPDAWEANPWVVAVSFTVQRGNIDQEPTP